MVEREPAATTLDDALTQIAAIQCALGEMLRTDPDRATVMGRLRQMQKRYAGARHRLAPALGHLIEELESQQRIGV